MEELRKTLHRLNENIESGSELKVHRTIAMAQLVKTLQKEDYISVNNNESDLILKPTRQVIAFFPIYSLAEIIGRRNTNIARREIPGVATKLLPSITGTIILTTRTGIMSHHEAIIKNTGGNIIGIAY